MEYLRQPLEMYPTREVVAKILTMTIFEGT